MTSSNYIDDQRREYSLYVLQNRAIPHAADGLKAGARRILWMAKNGKHFKSATLAGATLPIHPHSPPETAINTLAAPYGNNITLLAGDGAFGTLLSPSAFGAARYTSVNVSEFTKDVVFKDIEIIPVQDNYDGTLEEPKHFLPLVPIALLNPQEGIAVGFASNILPRSLDSIITSLIQHLTGKRVPDVYPTFTPTNNYCEDWVEATNGSTRWIFTGEFEKVNATTIRITNLPYGTTHVKYDDFLNKLLDENIIADVEDNSKDFYDIEVRFKKGTLSKMSNEEIIKLMELQNLVPENLNVINFDGTTVLSTDYVELIKLYAEWRLGWYVQRYQRLQNLIEIDIQRYKDILISIRKNVGGLAKKIQSRSELKEYLDEIGVVYLDYIADLPVYRFTEEERKKVEAKLDIAIKQLKEYKSLLRSEDKRRAVYITELKEVLAQHKKGKYDTPDD